MQTGVVKWFNNAKGYGFILTDIENKDVFAHYSAVEMDGYRTLRAGQCVAFEAVDGPKGLHAASIKILAEAPDVSGEPKNADISLTAPLSNGLDTDITPSRNEETESAI
jgi:CspA family cold shock protein